MASTGHSGTGTQAPQSMQTQALQPVSSARNDLSVTVSPRYDEVISLLFPVSSPRLRSCSFSRAKCADSTRRPQSSDDVGSL